jgi:predicted DNA-binding WGR domain protein
MEGNMKISETYMEHEGGTKFYRVIALQNEHEGDRHGLIVTNYGKIGTHGRIKVETYHYLNVPGRYARSVSSKSRRGYEAKNTASFDSKVVPLSEGSLITIRSLMKQSPDLRSVIEKMGGGGEFYSHTEEIAATESLTPAQMRKLKAAEELARLPAGWGDW